MPRTRPGHTIHVVLDGSQAPEVALELELELGEGVFWDAARESLVWVDILGGAVHELAGGVHRVHAAGTYVGMAAPRARGGWILAVRQGFAALDPDSGQVELLKRIEIPGTRMNDGNVDARGRLFAGTMLHSEEPNGGRLYRLDPDLSLSVVLDPVSISNGIDWSPDGRSVYYVDSGTRAIAQFEFDEESGAWSNRRVFAQLEATDGYPDGLTVDREGGIWLAVWDGSQVRRYTPDGRIDRILKLPAPLVSSCGFGGPDLATLYITTARVGLSANELEERPLSGSLFACEPGVTGNARRPFIG
jgi:sugar lactone lactonase YvrE